MTLRFFFFFFCVTVSKSVHSAILVTVTNTEREYALRVVHRAATRRKLLLHLARGAGGHGAQGGDAFSGQLSGSRLTAAPDSVLVSPESGALAAAGAPRDGIASPGCHGQVQRALGGDRCRRLSDSVVSLTHLAAHKTQTRRSFFVTLSFSFFQSF